MELNKQIKKERERQRMTLYKVGKLTGVNPSHIEKIENGLHSPSVQLLMKICAALNISVTINPDGTTTVKSKK